MLLRTAEADRAGRIESAAELATAEAPEGGATTNLTTSTGAAGLQPSNRASSKAILMIAYHFPPCSVSSGLQRTLGFSRHLPKYGWNPIILSAHPRAYVRTSDDQLRDIPETVPVHRAFCLDTSVHLAFQRRYFSWMALPDQWVSWLVGAVPAGLKLIRKHRPRVIWSTYPIATAHLIAYTLHRLTGIPWLADFRDPMVEIDPVTKQEWPTDPAVRRARRWVERLTIEHCSRAIFAAPGSQRIYEERYGNVPRERLALIRNGYEEESFAEIAGTEQPPARDKQQVVLLHAGVLYPSPDRHPGAFFLALKALRQAGTISPSNLKVILRASHYQEVYRTLVHQYALEDMVFLEPAITYRQALNEMLKVDGLLVFQGHDSNPAIPAKLYEYFRARRPIFALVDSEGDTAAELRAARVGRIVPLDNSEEIAAGLLAFLSEVRTGRYRILADDQLRQHSRETKTRELAELLHESFA